MPADGSQHAAYFIAEATYGTTPATPAFTPLRNGGCTLGLNKDNTESKEIRGDRMTSDSRHGARKVSGGFDIELGYGTYDVILEALLGGTWTADTPVTGTSQLKVGTTRRSFSVLRKFGDLQSGGKPYHLFTGIEFNSLQLTLAANAIIPGKLGCIGQNLALSTTAPTGATYNAASATKPLDTFQGALKEGGSTIALVTEIQLNIDNGMESRFVVGSTTSLRPSQGRCSVNGSASVYFEDSTMLEKFINETESSMEITLPDAAGNELKFLLPRIKYNGGQPDVSNEGPIILSMPFVALRDSVSGSSLLVERNPA
jgi:hypothetical protein